MNASLRSCVSLCGKCCGLVYVLHALVSICSIIQTAHNECQFKILCELVCQVLWACVSVVCIYVSISLIIYHSNLREMNVNLGAGLSCVSLRVWNAAGLYGTL